MSSLALYLLGAPRLERDGAPVHITRRKVMALLAYLAVTGRPHNREVLVTLLSPELDTSHARTEFRRTLAVLKRILGSDHLRTDRETVTLRTAGHLRLREAQLILPAPNHTQPDHELWLDVAQFRALLAPCEAEDHPSDPSGACATCAPRLEEAVALYRDDFMAGFNLPDSLAFEEWQFFQAEAFRDLLTGALQRLIVWHSAQARRWLALNPLREPAHRQLMELYAGAGRRAAALHQYRQCLRLLEEELGVSPSPETAALYQRIRTKDVAREEKSPVPVTVTPPASAPLPAFLSEETPPTRGERPLFVARERELARLDSFLEAALKGQAQLAFITGGPGRGKTALMEAFSRRAIDAHPDLLVAVGRCTAYAGAGAPYLPFRDLLGMLSGDVEGPWRAGAVSRGHARRLWAALPVTAQALVEHGAPLIGVLIPGAPMLSRATAAASDRPSWLGRLQALVQNQSRQTEERSQDRLFEAYTAVLRALAAHHPLLLLLDDLQWVDSASAGLLFHLGRRLAGSRIIIVGAYRPEEISRDRGRHPLEKVLAEFKRTFGDVGLDLTQADEIEGRAFVDALLDAEPNRMAESFRSALHAHTGGHPLFTVELLRAMQDRGDLVRDDEGRWVEGPALDWERLPARVEGVIQERVGRLDEGLRDILSIASVEGETFTAQVVAQVRGSDLHRLLRALSHQLADRHRLVWEAEPLSLESDRLYRYRFSHALFQQYLYHELSQGERALLHGEVAQALEALYQGHTDAIAVPVAHHCAQAGEGKKAIHYALLAGDQARMVYALDEAVAHYRSALALQKEMGDHDGAARTLMKLVLTHHLAFRFQAARQAYDEGFALWQRAAKLGVVGPAQPAPHPLRVMLPPTVRTLDPTVTWCVDSMLVMEQLFSGLLALTPELEAVPDVARRWDLSPDGRHYMFKLRQDVLWSDGAPVTAADFECAVKRILDPATESLTAGVLYDIQGGRAFHQGETRDPDRVGVRARDPFSFEVVLEEPAAYFPLVLTKLYPVPRHVVAVHGRAWTEPQHFVTNGPFRLESGRPGGSMVLVRNPDYHGRFPGNLRRVEIISAPDNPSLLLPMYTEDRVDVVEQGAMIPMFDLAKERYPGECVAAPALETSYLRFNVLEPPFNDRRVRRAFVLATDRERLAECVYQGWGAPATGGLVPPGMPGHAPGIALPYDPQSARQLLAEAGYTDHDFANVAMQRFARPLWRLTTEEMQRQWRANLGIEIAFQEAQGYDTFFEKTITRPPHLGFSAWPPDYPDPDNFMRVLVTGGAARWQDKAYQRLIAQARGLTDQAARMALYRQAEHIVVEEAPIVPLLYLRTPMLVKPWVKGLLRSPIGREIWKDVIIEPH